AKQRFRPRIWGHVRGANRVSAIVDEAARLGLESLTLYTFSTENWSRPTDEITNLFKILKKFLQKEKKNLIKNNIKFDVIGNYRVLDTKIVQIIDDIKYKTEKNTGLNLSLAINYGGRAEIVDAVNVFFKENRTREITEKDITEYLYNTNLTNIDLLIRTAGDTRISNFLLWQISYAELFFTETKWPEFTVDEFRQILQSVSGKERKFGSIENDTSLSHSKEKAQHNLKILS
ncbi:MAG: di-trans,poly-cis-decaprenylcistransferase, partial [Halobacteriovoraceae bacterium]|nr:di-trans,poly-cis-decaprenylcistransferase [Halobacteriovoraceae bacterium]